MTNTPSDFSNPEVPTNMRDFYVLYWNDRKALNNKLEEISESQCEDRDTVLKVIDRWEKWIKEHDEHLQTNLTMLTRHDEKIDSLDKKVNTWSITNSLAAIGAFIAILFQKGS